jgi:hypothetical protein
MLDYISYYIVIDIISYHIMFHNTMQLKNVYKKIDMDTY